MATKTETQINELKINYLTEAQYEEALANDEINDNEIYMTPASENTNTEEVFDNAGSHNCIYRGKNLGSSVTAAQYAEISAGTFKDMYIGDYWTINGVVYRIAAFDYYLGTGYNTYLCTSHHVTLVPDTCLYTYVMNDTNTTVGAFMGSKMYTEGLTSALNTVNTAFGSTHILSYPKLIPSVADNGYVTLYSRIDSKITLMNEVNVVGHMVYSNIMHGNNEPEHDYYDGTQYPLFRYRPDLICIGANYWLRDVASTHEFSCIYKSSNGVVAYDASNEYGVRPSFSIY